MKRDFPSKGKSELLPIDAGPLSQEAGIVANGLRLPPDLLFEDWCEIGTVLFSLENQKEFELQTIRAAIGDWIRFGESHYSKHQRYAQALETTGLSYSRIANLAWTMGKIPIERRRIKDGLTVEHHSVVASLPPPDQDCLLQQAVEEGLSSRDLRELAFDRRAENDGKDADEARAERALDRALAVLIEVDEKKWGTLVVERLLEPLVKKRWQLSQTVIALLEGV